MSSPNKSLLIIALGTALAWAPVLCGETRAELSARLSGLLDQAHEASTERRFDQAETLYRQVLDEVDSLASRSIQLARATDGLADVLRESGRLEEAEPLYVRAVGLWEVLLGPRQPRLAVSLHNLGVVRLELGRPAQAAPSLERALDIWSESYGPESVQARNTRRAWQRAVSAASPAQISSPAR